MKFNKRKLVVIVASLCLLQACGQNNALPKNESLIQADAVVTLLTQQKDTMIVVQVDSTVLSASKSRIFSKEELLGKFNPSSNADFTMVEKQYTSKQNIYLRIETYSAFKKMNAAAAKDGINLVIISATRNFEAQKSIWEKKWKREKYVGLTDLDKVTDILKYSSMPGTSRHHWGTDVDFNSVELNYFATQEGMKTYNWLIAHAKAFGFVQTYNSKKTGRKGYDEEKWHWSYIPLASQILEQYNEQISYSDLNGFSGSSSAKAIGVIENFVNGINTD